MELAYEYRMGTNAGKRMLLVSDRFCALTLLYVNGGGRKFSDRGLERIQPCSTAIS